MPTHKKFIMYAIWVILFFIFSQIMINVAINTTYKGKNIEVKTEYISEAKAQATSINGFTEIKLDKDVEKNLSEKYIKLEAYSNNNTQMGTKYINIGNAQKNDEGKIEIRFNFNKVDKVVLDIIDEIPQNITEEQKKSDPKRNFIMVIGALIIVSLI